MSAIAVDLVAYFTAMYDCWVRWARHDGLTTHFAAVYDLRVRWAEQEDEVNQMVYTTDPFSIDVTAEPRRGTDAQVVGWLRSTEDGEGVTGATGTLRLWVGGVLTVNSPYPLTVDARGVGFFSCVVGGADLLARTKYRWEVIANVPGGGTALAEGEFVFR